ncbi:insulinase family protein [candidate division NPL-UPA2 bacterium]|nr:insulinase family protein [candidate division NPL-UPA2 bacterium]
MYQETVLENGLTVVTHRMPSASSSSVGLWIRAGGRFETKDNNGVSHFLEHLLFKGTKKRSYRQIKESIEGIGGSLNGFTAEELTCYLAKVIGKHLPLALDVLSDMVLNPLLKEEDVEKERMVIVEEIKMYEDLPASYVHALFGELLWPDQPLGFMIAGRQEVIATMGRDEILNYKNRLYNPSNLVVAVAGKLEHQKVVEEVKKAFGALPRRQRNRFSKVQEKQSKPRIKLKSKDTEQTHLCLGGKALPRDHPDKYALGILNVILGGNMSSRLFNEVREKRGLAYEIRSSIARFQDTGALVISAGVDNRKVAETIKIILRELKKFKEREVSKKEFQQGKEFVIGQLLLSLEDTTNYMHWLGENKLCLGRVPSVEEVLDGIKKVTARDLHRIANGLFTNENLNLALIGPVTVNSTAYSCKKEEEIEKILQF